MAPRPLSRPSGSLILHISLIVISAFVIGSASTPSTPSPVDYRLISRLIKRLKASPLPDSLLKLPSNRYNASDLSTLSISAVDRLLKPSPPSDSSLPRDSRIPFQIPESPQATSERRRRLQALRPSGRKSGKYTLGNPVDLSKLKIVRFSPLSSSGVSNAPGTIACKGQKCPDFSACPGLGGKVSACWNPADPEDPDADLAAYGRTVLLNRTQSYIHWSTGVNPLDQCLEDDGTQPGHLLRPGCPPDDDPGPITLSLRTAELRAKQAQARRRLKWGKAGKKEPEPAGQLFVLEDVYLDGEGRVFNATHRFDVSGCAKPATKVVYGLDTHVSRQETVLNLLLPGHFMERRPMYDQILMVLPPLLPLHHVLPSLRQAKVVTHAKKLLQLLISQLLGLSLAKHSFLANGEPGSSSKYLWHVKKLYQPVIPYCSNPDLPLWKHFRRRFLLPSPPPPDTTDPTATSPILAISSSPPPPLSLTTPPPPSSACPRWPPGFLDGARSVFPSLPALPDEGYAQGGDLHGSWVPIGWQVVVAHDSMRCTKALGQVEELLHRYFPPDRIFVFSSSRKIMEGKHIFNRAALFITCLGLAITNTMFMPPRAAVLDLRPPIPANLATHYTLLSRSFASANDLRSFVLICQPGDDVADPATSSAALRASSGQLACNAREIDDVIDRVAHDIYSSPGAIAAAMSPARDAEAAAEAAAEALADAEANGRSLLRPTDLIRGSVLRSSLQVQKFRSWMKCVGQEGSWVYDPKPRRLPWWFMGKPYQCDSALSGRHLGKAMGAADKIADEKGDPEEWTVRESLKYKWGVPANACPRVPLRSWEVEDEEEGPEGGMRTGGARESMRMTMRFAHTSWLKFTPEKFCERVGRGRLFLFLGIRSTSSYPRRFSTTSL
ncbi:hypothetical protein CLOM_g15739 [Closterium sp. NIES-68]|nr:hypothetical protein CLOM_g15739 [Closterium sp. NIES-68]